MLIVLLPGRDRRVLGISTRTRNTRVAARVGATAIDEPTLSQYGNEPAVLVPAGAIIDVSLFSVPEPSRPTWLTGGDESAVLAGPAHDLQPYGADLSAAATLVRQPAAEFAVLDGSTFRACRRAEWSLLLRSGKSTDGWVSRHCTRPISRVISLVMLWMGFKANHASVLTLLVGLAAAGLALHPGYLPLVGTGILFQLASVLDGVDGEIARTTLTESASGALLDTIVDEVTYVACFLGVTIGWVREGAGLSALFWTVATSVGLILSLVRGGRFVARHAPNASYVFIDRSVRRAARDSGRVMLKLAAALFTLLRRDAGATVLFFVALAGHRVLIAVIVASGIVLANFTFSRYRSELAAAAVVERLAG
jgi:phosphatidylglycerophosphate synthase